MKIRNGFVSNSSSSSFVVAFPQKPTSRKILQEMLFGDKKFYKAAYGDDSWPVEEVIDILWPRLEGQSANNIEKITEEFDSGDFDIEPFEIDGQFDKDGFKKVDWNACDKARAIHVKKEAESFILSHPGYYIYVFELSDNCNRLEGNMEHGSLFSNLPHQSFSHH